MQQVLPVAVLSSGSEAPAEPAKEAGNEKAADGRALRGVMRRVPSPVTIVTAAPDEAHPDAARGITIGSFVSVSLEPPLVSFNVDREGQMYDVLRLGAHFAVHVLAREQTHLAAHFAVPDCTGSEQFDPVPHRTTARGTPVLDGALAVLFCTVREVFDAGDHHIILGAVQKIDEQRASGEPIVYYRSSYRSVDGEVVPGDLAEPTKRESSLSPSTPRPKRAKS